MHCLQASEPDRETDGCEDKGTPAGVPGKVWANTYEKTGNSQSFCYYLHSAVPSGRSCGLEQPPGGIKSVGLRR